MAETDGFGRLPGKIEMKSHNQNQTRICDYAVQLPHASFGRSSLQSVRNHLTDGLSCCTAIYPETVAVAAHNLAV